MALKRVYSFDVAGGPVVDRVALSVAAKQDGILQLLGITNWQLAVLAAVARHTLATSSRIGRSLAMDRTTVAATMKPLRDALAVETHALTGRRGIGFGLTKAGSELLAKGLYVWSDANLASVCGNDNKISGQSGDTEAYDLSTKKIA